jgi:hypothetical protein
MPASAKKASCEPFFSSAQPPFGRALRPIRLLKAHLMPMDMRETLTARKMLRTERRRTPVVQESLSDFALEAFDECRQ